MLFLILFTSSCHKNDDNDSNIEVKERTILFSTTDTIFYAEVDNVKIPVYISLPGDCEKKNYSAMVVMHGSDGMWKNQNPKHGILSNQNTEWKELFNKNCFVSAFVDSYSTRGCVKRDGKWKTAPDNFKISSQFVRPKDAYAALSVLKSLRYQNGQKVVIEQSVGLLGFSDGATAVASTLYDSASTPLNWEWHQKFDKKQYSAKEGVKPPIEKPLDGGFAAGVFYYGGSGGYSYWGGSPCGENYFYNNYAPMLYQIPSEGYLTENTLCSIDFLSKKGAEIEVNIYEGAEHGFDDANDLNSKQVRFSTIEWLKEHLNKD